MGTERIAVLGAGSWGTALAIVLSRAGHPVMLQTRRAEHAAQLQSDRCNAQYLPDQGFPDNLHVTHEIEEAVSGAECVFIAVPSQAYRATVENVGQLLSPSVPVVSTTKGFELTTFQTMSQITGEVLGEQAAERLAILSGPTIATEVAANRPTAAVVAGVQPKVTAFVQQLFSGTMLRAYTGSDVIGVEVGGAVKNVIAIAAGVCDGMSVGDNGKAALMTRGLAEMSRLGRSLGAQPTTFLGLSGIGDCILTCMSAHSRNHRLGIALGRGSSPDEARLSIGPMIAEGDLTAQVAHLLGQRLGISMPIADAVHAVLHNGDDLATVARALLQRVATDEEAQ